MLAAWAILAGCATPAPDVVRYDCERGGTLEVEYLDGEVAVVLAGRRHRLARVESASGERWERDEVIFWSRGAEASVSIGDQVVAWGCRRGDPDAD